MCDRVNWEGQSIHRSAVFWQDPSPQPSWSSDFKGWQELVVGSTSAYPKSSSARGGVRGVEIAGPM